MKTIIERGASWTLEETKLLLALWGQDLVQRQATNQKRTKEVYEKISEKFTQSNFERTADQVRTRVFNMIAEYRRILKDPNPERMKKCIFFEALHKIYQAKHMDDVKSAVDNYEPEYPYSPASNTICSDKGDESISDSEAMEGTDTATNTTMNNQSSISNITLTSNNLLHDGSMVSGTVANNNNRASSATSDNNGDSINSNENDYSSSNNNTEKESSSAQNSHQSSAKKIKLESPKSGASQNQSTTNSSSSEHATVTNSNASKQNKSSASQAGLSVTNTASTSSATAASSSSSAVKHQSLLMPNSSAAIPSATSTPITKLASTASNTAPSYININSTKLPIIRTNQLIGHSNGNDSLNLNGTTARLPTTAAIGHQLYQAPVNTFDVTSSALLIDRMFAHLSRESENMREWIALEKERLALERSRRAQETEREVRRERVLIDTLMRFQDQWITFLTRLDPRIVENAPTPPPELRLPPRDSTSGEASQTSNATTTQVGTSSTPASANTTSTSMTSISNSSAASTESANTKQ